MVAELRPDLATNADHETNHYVVYRLRLALDILKKPGATEQQRKEYEIILAAAAPELRGDKLTDPRGMATKVAAVLNVSRRVGGPFSKSIDRRQEIDKLAKLCDEPIEVGDAVGGVAVDAPLQVRLDGRCARAVRLLQHDALIRKHWLAAGFGLLRSKRRHVCIQREGTEREGPTLAKDGAAIAATEGGWRAHEE